MIKDVLNGMVLVKMSTKWDINDKSVKQTEGGLYIPTKASDEATENPYEEAEIVSINKRDNLYELKVGDTVGIDVGAAKNTRFKDLYLVPNINIRYML